MSAMVISGGERANVLHSLVAHVCLLLLLLLADT